jgi:hypothetical protein
VTAERKSGKKMCALRTDRGGEFTVVRINEYFGELGVRRELMALYTPQQNGVVESKNQTMVGAARSMLKAKELPGIFWGEGVTAAVYALNRMPTRGNGGRTPYKLWVGNTPAMHHMRMFGVRGTREDNRLSEETRRPSKPAIFIEYASSSKAYRAYDPKTQRDSITRDMVFDEEAKWDWSI